MQIFKALLLKFIILGTISLAIAQHEWEDWFPLPNEFFDGSLTANGGFVLRHPANSEGYYLQAGTEDPSLEILSELGAIFDDLGELTWAIEVTEPSSELDPETPYYQTLISISESESPGNAWVLSQTSDGHFKYGIVDVETLTPLFAKKFPVGQPESQADYFPLSQSKFVHTETEPGEIRIRIFDSSGTLLVSKSYISTRFTGRQDLGGGADLYLQERPNGSGYILSITSLENNSEEIGKWDLAISALYLDEAGEILTQSHFQLEETVSSDEVSTFPLLQDDGSVVYILSDSDNFEVVGANTRTYLMRVEGNGALGYASRISGLYLLPNPQDDPSDTSATLAGVYYYELGGETASDVVLANLDLSDRSISESKISYNEASDTFLFSNTFDGSVAALSIDRSLSAVAARSAGSGQAVAPYLLFR